MAWMGPTRAGVLPNQEETAVASSDRHLHASAAATWPPMRHGAFKVAFEPVSQHRPEHPAPGGVGRSPHALCRGQPRHQSADHECFYDASGLSSGSPDDLNVIDN